VSRRIQALVFISAATVFVILVAHAGVRGLLESLASARWAIVPSVAAWGIVYACNTFAWQTLLDGAIPFGRAYVITVSSFAINYVTPLMALGGEPFRASVASGWVGTPRATASVVGFRIIHTLGQLLFWITALPLAYALLPRNPATTISLIALGFVFVALGLALATLFRHGLAVRLLDILARVKLLRPLAARLERRRPTLAAIDEQLTALAHGDRRTILKALGAEYVGRCVSMLEYLFIARALGLQIDYLTAFTIGAFSQFFTNATFFIPFELGTKEGSLSLIFEMLGLPADLGVYASIVSRIREMIWIAIGLTLVWAVRRERA
jgi:Lysylphosphatidylglycerol synthase TM region